VRARYVFGGMAVRDYDSGRAWYDAFFGRPPDLLPNDNEAAWQLNDGASVYIVGDGARAGGGLLALFVDDLDEQLRTLTERGIAAGPVEVVGGETRTAVVADPDGNKITLGQLPGT
jgi:catechol 2,3-dioxygenase-like lactoylglutathione lyase family enzyme